MSSVLVNDGRVLMAEALQPLPCLFGLGTGNRAWDSENPEPINLDANQLIAPLGYKKAHAVHFVTPVTDPAEPADIVLNTGRYRISSTPTRYLNYVLKMDYTDVVNEVREYHLYCNPTLQAGLPIGQTWFTPEQVENVGRLLLSERRKSLTFDGTMGAWINFVVVF